MRCYRKRGLVGQNVRRYRVTTDGSTSLRSRGISFPVQVCLIHFQFQHTARRPEKGDRKQVDVLGREVKTGMLTIEVLAVSVVSFPTCAAYCSAMPGPHVSGGVARIRATCEAVSAAPLAENRAMEPVPMPSKERRNKPLCSELLFLFIEITREFIKKIASVNEREGLLVESELIFQNCFVCHHGLLGVVLLWIFEFLMCGGQGWF